MIPDSLPNESMAKVGHFWLCKNSAGIFTVPKTRPTVYHMSLEVCMKVHMACLKLLFNNFIITAVLGESVRHPYLQSCTRMFCSGSWGTRQLRWSMRIGRRKNFCPMIVFRFQERPDIRRYDVESAFFPFASVHALLVWTWVWEWEQRSNFFCNTI